MSEVILKSPREKPIEPLVVAALEAEKNEILTAIFINAGEKVTHFSR